MVFLDLKKALIWSTCMHEILLSKLRKYGIHGVAYKWFKSYLEDRRRATFHFWKGHFPKNVILSAEVRPQGTTLALGPPLFLVFIINLPNCFSNSHPRMYAGDTNLTYSGNDINTIQFHLNEDYTPLQ